MTNIYELQGVFGEWYDADSPTYVDRAGLDAELNYALKSSNLIIIHGESRQGKTILQRKHLSEDQIIKINCSVGMTALDIKQEILRKMGAVFPIQTNETHSGNTLGKSGLDGGFNLLGLSANLGTELQHSTVHETMKSAQFIGNPNTINFIIEHGKHVVRRIVIDDFHYLSDQEQSQLAFDFKGLSENGIKLLVIGVWAQTNRLTTFNSQLRTKEISIKWTDDELMQVLALGEKVLNISISTDLKSQMVRDSSGSVGLLQIIAEALCSTVNVFDTQRNRKSLDDPESLNVARKKICIQKLNSRFSQALRVIADGKNQSEGRMYEKILRAVVLMSDNELLNGIRPGVITKKVESLKLTGTKGNQGHVTQTLERLNELQAERRISPPLFYYDNTARELRLVDRTFLFYRKYTTVQYPWEIDGT